MLLEPEIASCWQLLSQNNPNLHDSKNARNPKSGPAALVMIFPILNSGDLNFWNVSNQTSVFASGMPGEDLINKDQRKKRRHIDHLRYLWYESQPDKNRTAFLPFSHSSYRPSLKVLCPFLSTPCPRQMSNNKQWLTNDHKCKLTPYSPLRNIPSISTVYIFSSSGAFLYFNSNLALLLGSP